MKNEIKVAQLLIGDWKQLERAIKVPNKASLEARPVKEPYIELWLIFPSIKNSQVESKRKEIYQRIVGFIEGWLTRKANDVWG